MKHVLVLALRYLRFNKIKTVILVFSIAVAVFLPLAVNLLVRDYQRDLLARANATALVAGAPGSRLDLVLHALYFRGKSSHDLAMADVSVINGSGLALGIPILNKHEARGLPIVGTSLEYFDFRGLRVADGTGITRLGDCLLGATAAAKLGLRPGDKLMSDPENVFDLAGSYPINMHVKGILAPTGTADDGAVFVDIKTEWLIMGIMHGHEDVAKADPSLLLGRDASNIVASAALLPYQEVTSSNAASFHWHGDPATFPVSAIIVAPHDDESSAILRGRYQDPKATVQLLVPKQVVAETLDLVFRVKHFFDAQALLVGVTTVLLLALVVLLSLRLRRGEMETMFKIGCARWMIFSMQATEIVIVVAVGVAIAGGLSWIVLRELGLSGSRTDVASAPTSAPVSNAKKRVAVVNYPLQYFTKRIAGDQVNIFFPVPQDEDPAFWKPQDKDIVNYQQVDVILLNGAEYEKWLPAAVLPLTKQVITSQAFMDRYVTNGEVITHSHGPQGMHSHGLIDFNTWMDPQQAALQAQSIRDELVRLVPSAAKEFDANLAALQKELGNLDTTLATVSLRLGKEPLLGSHPVYQYTARRYGWDLRSVHWEPDEMPSEEEWKKLVALHEKHPAKLMIWEETPLPAVIERLRKMGIEPVAFETCASAPTSGDYMSAMYANAKRLDAALVQVAAAQRDNSAARGGQPLSP
jgi:putative ABC transport system permease protein